MPKWSFPSIEGLHWTATFNRLTLSRCAENWSKFCWSLALPVTLPWRSCHCRLRWCDNCVTFRPKRDLLLFYVLRTTTMSMFIYDMRPIRRLIGWVSAEVKAPSRQMKSRRLKLLNGLTEYWVNGTHIERLTRAQMLCIMNSSVMYC